MTPISQEVRERLQESFRAELQEHVETMTNGLLALEQQQVPDEERAALLDDVFRAAHSLKGAARTMDAQVVAQLAHALEDVLDRIRRDVVAPSPTLFTACYQTLDIIQIAQAEGQGEGAPEIEPVLAALAPFRGAVDDDEPASLSEAEDTREANANEAADAADAGVAGARLHEALRASSDSDTIRVNVGKLDALMAQLSELLLTKIRVEQRLSQLREVEAAVARWQDRWLNARGAYTRLIRQCEGARPEGAHIDMLQDQDLETLFEYLDDDQAHLRDVNALLSTLSRQYANDTLHMSLVIDELEEEIKRVRMLPFSTILSPFGRMVRDLAYEAGKEVVLDIVGAETELDKRVLEQIKDPLMHLLRNAVDHGIEPPEVREAQGKPRYGTLTLAAEQVGKDVVIRVSDDGRGLDLDAIREAVARHYSDAAYEMSEAELEQAIYNAGVSTSPIVTDVSGRGVGLDVVRRNVAALRGRIDMTWEPGEGTTFVLTLPLALSSMHGLLVHVGEQRFAIPLNAIERMMALDWGRVSSMGGQDVVRYRDQHLPLVRLADVLELSGANGHGQDAAVVILAAAERRMAFIVDALSGEQEIVNKGLGRQLARVGGIAGATVMGNGEIVLVLNVADLIQMTQRSEHTRARARASVSLKEMAPSTRPQAERAGQRLLIVDDSITTRTLEKNILEAAGYTVQIATNGQEAWGLIAGGETPDLVVSDVAMPQMDGIDLTRRIKGQERTAEIPVILVTSLDSTQDKARGIDAGADAYITKGAFDQNNLLRTIQQLI